MGSEDGLVRYIKKIKKLPTVMRLEIDYHHNKWWVTYWDERWSLPRGIAHPSQYEALKQVYEELVADLASS